MTLTSIFTRKTIFSASLVAFFFVFSITNGYANNERKGTIIETMDAANYTYLNIKTANQQVWVAIPTTSVKVGEKVTYLQGMAMTNFHSKSLDKTFDSIIFSPGLEGHDKRVIATASAEQQQTSSFADAVNKENKKPAQPQMDSNNTSGSAGAMVPFLEANVEKAEGENSYTVEEIFENAKSLDGKAVRIKGKVVKVSPNIMGKNWIHIQDGTGDPMKNSHDLVITTTDLAEVNQVILIEGVMAANKDFGYGYKYDAIIEEAALIQE